MKPIIIQTTFKNEEEAKKLSNILIVEKLAACVQLKEIKSIYSWKNKICCDNETLVNIKTKKSFLLK